MDYCALPLLCRLLNKVLYGNIDILLAGQREAAALGKGDLFKGENCRMEKIKRLELYNLSAVDKSTRQ